MSKTYPSPKPFAVTVQCERVGVVYVEAHSEEEAIAIASGRAPLVADDLNGPYYKKGERFDWTWDEICAEDGTVEYHEAMLDE